MATRNSFHWPATHPTLPNVLKAHGDVESNDPGDVKQAEADDVSPDPGKWTVLRIWRPFLS